MAILKVGDNAPNFSLTDNEGKFHSLKDYFGIKLIIFFYPRANTPGCTAQSCNLNDNYSKLTSQGYEVIGVSPDTVDKQNKFADKFGFKYNLLADDSRELIDAFGVWGKKKFRGNEYEGVLRTTFIINIHIKKLSKLSNKINKDCIIFSQHKLTDLEKQMRHHFFQQFP